MAERDNSRFGRWGSEHWERRPHLPLPILYLPLILLYGLQTAGQAADKQHWATSEAKYQPQCQTFLCINATANRWGLSRVDRTTSSETMDTSAQRATELRKCYNEAYRCTTNAKRSGPYAEEDEGQLPPCCMSQLSSAPHLLAD